RAGPGSARGGAPIRLPGSEKRRGPPAALMVGPDNNNRGQEGYSRHFAAVADAVPALPIVLYNIPGRTGSNILPETIARLAKIPNIVGIKEATGSLDQASQISALCDLTILSGDDSLTLPLMSIGGGGGVCAVRNTRPG